MKLASFLFLALVPALEQLPAADKLKIASFSSILTEVAKEVGKEHVEVVGLIKPDEDPHEYQPTPADLKEVANSRLIITSGKHLENYLNKLQEATGGKAAFLSVGDHLASLKMKPEEGGTDVLIEDPHWWNSVKNVEEATRVVRDELIKLDPANKESYDANAKQYLSTLKELASWASRKIADLPRDKRKLVTSHDAFQYFARDYGFTIYAIEGLSTESEPSNRHVAELIDEIKAKGVKAIFVESTLNPKVTSEITRETGAVICGTLYADGLGGGDAETFPGMFRHNVSTIVDALH